MGNPNTLPAPQSSDPVELGLFAVDKLYIHPEVLEAQLLGLGAFVVYKAFESAFSDPEDLDLAA